MSPAIKEDKSGLGFMALYGHTGAMGLLAFLFSWFLMWEAPRVHQMYADQIQRAFDRQDALSKDQMSVKEKNTAALNELTTEIRLMRRNGKHADK